MTDKAFELDDLADELGEAKSFALGISNAVDGLDDVGCDDYSGLRALVERHLSQLEALHKRAKEYSKFIQGMVDELHKQGRTMVAVPTSAPLSKSRQAAVTTSDTQIRRRPSRKKPKLTLVETAPACPGP